MSIVENLADSKDSPLWGQSYPDSNLIVLIC